MSVRTAAYARGEEAALRGRQHVMGAVVFGEAALRVGGFVLPQSLGIGVDVQGYEARHFVAEFDTDIDVAARGGRAMNAVVGGIPDEATGWIEMDIGDGQIGR